MLGLDEPELFALAGLEPPLVIEDHPTIEQSLREIAPREAPPAPAPSPVQQSLLDSHRGSAAPASEPPISPSGRHVKEADRALDTDPEPLPSLDAILASLDTQAQVPAPLPVVPPPSTTERKPVVEEAPSPPSTDLAPPAGADPAPARDTTPNAATMIPGVVPANDPAAGPEVRRRDLRSSPAPAQESTPLLNRLRDLTVRWRNRPPRSRPPAPIGIASAPSYIEIPEERVVYLRRRVYTTAAVLIALLLAIWSYGAAKTALAETLDLLLSGF